MKLATISLVGPGEIELERLGRMLRSLFLFASEVEEVVLIDDSLISRGLERLYPAPANVRVTSLVNERLGKGPGIFGGACTGLLQALRYISTHRWAEAVIKIDTDALVVNPFEKKIEFLLRSEPDLGTAGVVEWNCDGSPRTWEPFSGITRKLAKLIQLQRHELLPRRQALWGHRATLRRLVQRARRRGYRWGEHSQGGSYLISGLLIQRMRQLGFLEHGTAWLDIFMCEDPMMGIYARACGLKNVHFGKSREVFGSHPIGLPFRPQELLDRDYSIVHSTKKNLEPEADLYEFFCGDARLKELRRANA